MNNVSRIPVVFILISFSIFFISSCEKKPTLPTVSTTGISGVTQTTASSGGNVTDDGGAEVTARGVCWCENENPSTLDHSTIDGSGSGSFTSSLTSLTPGITYYVRAYAINRAGTAYGKQVSFTTETIHLPSLTTTTVTSIALTTAVSGGNITSDGGGTVTTRGICWSTSANPTTTMADSLTDNGSGTGAFISNMTGLIPATTYYVRAYAINSAGTAYGNEVSFTTQSVQLPSLTTTDASSITPTSAVSGGDITSDGGASVTARGVCWSTSTNPTTSDNTTSDGTGTGSFTSNLSGLTRSTSYYVRAYATNSAGTAYGNEVSFSTAAELPTLTTVNVSAITRTSATSGGNITDDGGASVTARGVCWSTSANPTTADNTTNDGTGTGIYSSDLTGLYGSTTYYVRAYAVNSAGTAYGDQVLFTTDPVVLATLTTTPVTSILSVSARSGGNITDDGGGEITARGVCWNSSEHPDINDNKTTDGTGSGSFTSVLTGLEPDWGYYVRAYATNSAGTAYGNELYFGTDAIYATLETNDVTDITSYSATSGGYNIDPGDTPISAKGICYSLQENPRVDDDYVTNEGSGTDDFTSQMTGLVINTTYYVRAYATNGVGTAYGNQRSFTTSNIPAPINFNTGLTYGTVSDIDGNIYKTITIGTQTWMAENLKTTTLNDGTPIQNVTGDTEWGDLTTPGFCIYDNEGLDYKDIYGCLYNWYAVNTNNLCPAGWHVPSTDELTTLSTFLGGWDIAVDKLRETGNTHWRPPNEGATNESGFTALPGGNRSNPWYSFYNLGDLSNWWSIDEESSTYAYSLQITTFMTNSAGIASRYKRNGFSVRCMKDE